MRKLAPTLLLRLALLVAIFCSAALLVEYQHAGDPGFCGAASGCHAVRRSRYAQFGPLSLPAIGLGAFVLLNGWALWARDKEHTSWLSAAAFGGALLGGLFIGLQAFVVHAWCKWCLGVDVASFVVAGAAGWLHLDTLRDGAFLAAFARRRAQLVGWAAAVAAVIALPFVWAQYPVVPPPPPAIAALGVPGKTTVVNFTDFECPYCRKLHPVLHEVVGGSNGGLALVRKMAPMKGHAGARPAARAYLCTPEAQRDQMAGALYDAPPEHLVDDGPAEIGAQIGLDREALLRCMAAPATEAAVVADTDLAAAAGVPGLPTTFVGRRLVLGYQPGLLARVVRQELVGPRPALPVSWMLAAFALIALAVVGASARLAGPAAARPSREPREDEVAPAP